MAHPKQACLSLTPLSNVQIEQYLSSRLPNSFKGVYDADSLPGKATVAKWDYPFAIVVNTMKDTTAGVGHWIAMVFTEDGKGHYFDSYGKKPKSAAWKEFLRSTSLHGKWTYSKVKVQSDYTNSCGYLAIKFIVMRLLKTYRHFADTEIANEIDEVEVCSKYSHISKL